MKEKKLLHFADVCVILALTLFALVDTFLLPKAYTQVASQSAIQTVTTSTSTSTSYSDETLRITITSITYDNTQVYIAEIETSDPSRLKTAFAQNTYGRNITETVRDMASENNAILAINGDFYGFRTKGYVVRNGVVYRTAANTGNRDLVISKDGEFSFITEGTDSIDVENTAHIFSFGPVLLEDGQIAVTSASDANTHSTSNQRTAIGEISTGHYLVVCSDARNNESAGLSLVQLAELMQSYGVQQAYNLDGGGSTTMVFQGKLINKPTTNGRSMEERKVSDIVYFN